MKKLLLLATLFLVGCSSPQRATKVLEQQGYKDIKITGYKPLACHDDYATGFVAVNPQGIRASGAVCESFTADAYIRLDVPEN